jgi:hypothetical protein
LTTETFTVLLDYPTAGEGTQPTARLDGTLTDREAFANFRGSRIVPAGVFVVAPPGGGIARIVMRLLHDFNLYEHERAHDF